MKNKQRLSEHTHRSKVDCSYYCGTPTRFCLVIRTQHSNKMMFRRLLLSPSSGQERRSENVIIWNRWIKPAAEECIKL